MITPVSAVNLSVAQAIAAAPILGSAGGAHVALIKAAFTPSAQLVLADLDLADFDTSTPLEASQDLANFGIDPTSGDFLAEVEFPVGGWLWEVTAGTNLPQTIFGFALLTNDEATLKATAIIDPPLTLNTVGQRVLIPVIEFRVAPSFLS